MRKGSPKGRFGVPRQTVALRVFRHCSAPFERHDLQVRIQHHLRSVDRMAAKPSPTGSVSKAVSATLVPASVVRTRLYTAGGLSLLRGIAGSTSVASAVSETSIVVTAIRT